jgi:hypothetical protein
MGEDNYITLLNYTLDSSNNSFIISRETTNGTKISDDIIITLDITLDEKTYSGKGIVDAINAKLSTHSKLDNVLSKIERKQVTDNKKENHGKYYYELSIYFNKKNDPYANVAGLTTYITFPDETAIVNPPLNKIWTGTNSLFNFKSNKEYTNVIIAESESHQTDYIINSSPYIVLKCIKEGFQTSNLYEPTNGSHGIPDASSNDFIIDISNYTANTGYNFTSYINEINTKLEVLNQVLTPVLNTSEKLYDNSFFQNNISYDSDNNKVVFTFNMNIEFTQKSYTIDFGDVFVSALGFQNPSSRTDLGGQIVGIKSDFNAYTITNGDRLATIYPKNTTKNYKEDPWVINYTKTTPGISDTFTQILQLTNTIKTQFDNFIIPNTIDSHITLTINSNTITQTRTTLDFSFSRTLTERDYDVYLYDASGNPPYSWTENLFFDPSYNLSANYDASISTTSISINSKLPIAGYTFYMDKPTYFTLSAITPGAYSSGGENNIVITIPKPPGNLYTRQELFNIIKAQLNAHPLTYGSTIESLPSEEPNPTNKQYVKMIIKINKMFTASDYKIVFYDQDSFVKCFVGTKSVRNVTWDSTLGWVLGFRSYTEYEFKPQNQYTTNIYSNASNIITLTSDTTMTTNIYDYFLIILDDYTQSHLNDGLVTIIPKDMSIPLPSYAKTKICNPAGNVIITNTTGSTNNLTANQLYAANTILNQAKAAKKSYSSGPYIQDVFGLIPLKLGIAAGQTYVEFGGTLQNQERVYFGPVNISRMTIKLINDRGEPVDLNGANWSFSFICEQLYNPNERSS